MLQTFLSSSTACLSNGYSVCNADMIYRQTPKEISEKYGHDIDLEIIENRTESFHVKPRPFGGHGRRLGNPTEEGQVQSAAGTFARSNISHEESNSSASGDEAMKPYINPSLPTTKLQIRLGKSNYFIWTPSFTASNFLIVLRVPIIVFSAIHRGIRADTTCKHV